MYRRASRRLRATRSLIPLSDSPGLSADKWASTRALLPDHTCARCHAQTSKIRMPLGFFAAPDIPQPPNGSAPKLIDVSKWQPNVIYSNVSIFKQNIKCIRKYIVGVKTKPLTHVYMVMVIAMSHVRYLYRKSNVCKLNDDALTPSWQHKLRHIRSKMTKLNAQLRKVCHEYIKPTNFAHSLKFREILEKFTNRFSPSQKNLLPPSADMSDLFPDSLYACNFCVCRENSIFKRISLETEEHNWPKSQETLDKNRFMWNKLEKMFYIIEGKSYFYRRQWQDNLSNHDEILVVIMDYSNNTNA